MNKGLIADYGVQSFQLINWHCFILTVQTRNLLFGSLKILETLLFCSGATECLVRLRAA